MLLKYYFQSQFFPLILSAKSQFPANLLLFHWSKSVEVTAPYLFCSWINKEFLFSQNILEGSGTYK